MNKQDTSSSEPQAIIIAAIRHVLRPLVRLLLSSGISYTTFCEMVKSAYVKVAEKEFTLDSKPQTDSRISLLTGIHRREINRLRNEPDEEIGLSQDASMSALLLTIWRGQPEYLDEYGMPIPLPRLASKGEKHSFEAMVQSVSKDFRPRVVLDEWLRQGIVTLDEEDNVILEDDTFIQPQDLSEKVFYFGQNIHDHLAATVNNLTGKSEAHLERCVFYDKLSAGATKELTDYSRMVGMRALNAVNKRAAELQKRDRKKLDAIHRANFGVYQYSEAEHKDEK